MGKILIIFRYIFLIYRVDINETRKHIHVTRNVAGYKKSCKFWIEPQIEIDENKKGDLSEIEMREVKRILEENNAVILQQLELFYQGKQVKAIKNEYKNITRRN